MSRNDWVNQVYDRADNYFEKAIKERFENHGFETHGLPVEIKLVRGLDEDGVPFDRVQAFVEDKEWGKGTTEKMVGEIDITFGYFSGRVMSRYEIEEYVNKAVENFVEEIRDNIDDGIRYEKEFEPVSGRTIYDGRHEQTPDTEKAPDNKERPEEVSEKPENGPEVGEKPETPPDKHGRNEWGDEPNDDIKPGRPHEGQRAGGPDDPGGPNHPPIEAPLKPEEKPKPVEEVAFDLDDWDGETSAEAEL